MTMKTRDALTNAIYIVISTHTYSQFDYCNMVYMGLCNDTVQNAAAR